MTYYMGIDVRRQEGMRMWMLRVFGEKVARNVPERALRFVEEAIELAQSVGVDRTQLHKLVDYVFDRPVGEPAKELGGSFVTLYAVAAALEVDGEAEFEKEFTRICRPEVIERVRRRQQEKREALLTDDYVPPCSCPPSPFRGVGIHSKLCPRFSR